VLGGVHGNELAGLEVVRRLAARLSGGSASGPPEASLPPQPLLRQGELVVAEGNPEACERNLRFVDVDLNRCFDRDIADSSSSSASVVTPDAVERRRASELAPLLTGLDVLVDLHGTNKPSAPFARLPGPVDGAYLRRCEASFLSFLPSACSTILWDPRQRIAAGGTTDEFALRNAPPEGGVYICYEAGLASDISAVAAAEAAVESMLVGLGMLPGSPQGRLERTWSQFEIFDSFVLDERGFEWANGHGGESFGRVSAGEAFGRRGSGGDELRAQEEAYIVFPKVEHLWGLGRPLGWLARRLPV